MWAGYKENKIHMGTELTKTQNAIKEVHINNKEI